MTLPIGHPCRFGDCTPGDLIRLITKDGSAFAFAAQGRETPDVAVAILLVDGLAGVPVDAYAPVLSYGKNYVFRESMDSDSLHTGGAFHAGVMEIGADADGPFGSLMFSHDGRALYYDVMTGRLVQRVSVSTLRLTKWSVLLKIDDDSSMVRIFQST